MTATSSVSAAMASLQLFCSCFPTVIRQNVEAQGDLGAHLLKMFKALIGLTPLVISWSKALPTFLQTPIKFWVRNIFCVKPLKSYGLSINTGSISVLQQIHWCCFTLYLPIFKPASVTFLAILWVSGTSFPFISFLFVTQNWFLLFATKTLIDTLVVKFKWNSV